MSDHPTDQLCRALTKRLGRRPRKEYAFHPLRRWRFDLCYPALRIAIEVDGGMHVSQSRLRLDAEKRNAALERGWRVLSYPASCVLTKKRLPLIVEQIARVVCGGKPPADETNHILSG